jgi:hypothetical protein
MKRAQLLPDLLSDLAVGAIVCVLAVSLWRGCAFASEPAEGGHRP